MTEMAVAYFSVTVTSLQGNKKRKHLIGLLVSEGWRVMMEEQRLGNRNSRELTKS